MSKNEEETGTLLLPAAAVIPLRKAFVEHENNKRAAILDLATRVHAHLKSDAGTADRKALSKVLKQPNATWGATRSFLTELIGRVDPNLRREDRAFDMGFQVERLLITRPEKGQTPKVQAPKKKDIAPLPAATWSFSGDECGINIDPKTRVLTWRVSRNNHAVENAWESPFGRLFSEQLRKIKWTRGTGGVFRYTDEYAEDAALEHGSNAVRISHAFGPLGEKEKEQQYGHLLRRPRPRK